MEDGREVNCSSMHWKIAIGKRHWCWITQEDRVSSQDEGPEEPDYAFRRALQQGPLLLDYSDRETEREEYSLLTSDDLHVVVYAYNTGISHFLQFALRRSVKTST